MIEIHGLLHASLLVGDTERSLGFYRGLLGLRQIPRPTLGFPGAWLEVAAGQQIHLLQLPNPDPLQGRPAHGGRDRHLALACAHLEPVQTALEAARIPYTLSASGRRALFCRDPDGNALELIETA